MRFVKVISVIILVGLFQLNVGAESFRWSCGVRIVDKNYNQGIWLTDCRTEEGEFSIEREGYYLTANREGLTFSIKLTSPIGNVLMNEQKEFKFREGSTGTRGLLHFETAVEADLNFYYCQFDRLIRTCP